MNPDMKIFIAVTEVRRAVIQGVQLKSGPILTHCCRVMQICVFNTVKLGTSASSP